MPKDVFQNREKDISEAIDMVQMQEYYSKIYSKGTVVELTTPIEDNYGASIPVGSRFQIDLVDAMCQLQGKWLPPQSGKLPIIIGHDSFKIVSE